MVSPVRNTRSAPKSSPTTPISFGVHNGVSKGKKFEVRPTSEFYVLGTVPESRKINAFLSFDSKFAGGAKGPEMKLQSVGIYEVKNGETGVPARVVKPSEMQKNPDGSFTLAGVDLPNARTGKFVVISKGTIDDKPVRIQSALTDTGDV
ncbi:MAG: hypothetical protein HY901_06325 [Deltaproteobacteria bacterium]|nr:hypothetical protein [Deltaproteobacteria bacterium]